MAALAAGKLKAFAGTINPATGQYLDDVYAQNKSLTEHVAADYHGRFLIELVQNGNDAHPRSSRDGAIEIVLAESEGDHGTLYVANRGNGFSEDDLVALSRIGMSSKPPGEAIGNKGLGFRSVSHVCDAPEIYSRGASQGAACFDGFCFTFATASELEELITDPRTLELARSDLPIFFLPRWLEDQNEVVRSFSKRGFASVIRLPLRDDGALRAARDELAALAGDRAPLLLFLDRIAALDASIVARANHRTVVAALSRKESPIEAAELDAVICTPEASRWLIFRDRVDEQSMRAAIAQGVEAKQLHSSWGGWSGTGEVALAVRLDADVTSPRLYTHLPMGEGAISPFAGQLHGTFFPTSNRKALDSSVALNELLLTRSTRLAVGAVAWLVDQDAAESSGAITREERARASVDLLAWHTPPSLVAAKAVGDLALDLGGMVVSTLETLARAPFGEIAVVPCAAIVGDELGVAWRPAAMARVAFDGTPTFDLDVVAAHGPKAGAALLWPGLGSERIRTLTAFLKNHALGHFRERMTVEERATIAASLAATIRAGRRPDFARWGAFYRDLTVFLADAPQALRTKRIILCDNGSVRGGSGGEGGQGDGSIRRRRRRRGESVEPSLFFPPAARPAGEAEQNAAEQLVVPKQLSSYFAFASSALPWHGQLRGAREFLEKASVNAYDGEAVLTRISQLVNAGATVEEAIAGLRWAFAIWRRAADAGRSIKVDETYRLRVPSADHSLIPATEAIFSESWPDHLLGRRVHAFLSAAPPSLTDLDTLRARRLAPISHRAFAKARIPKWAEFLSLLGVKCGLQPIALAAMPRIRAWEVTSLTFAPKLGVSEAAVEEWRRDLREHLPKSLQLSWSTSYRFVGPLWWLPGQGHHQHFNDDCREIFASLVIDWLATAPTESLRVTLTHDYYTSDIREWSTPAGAFVRSADWLPADDPTPTGPQRRHHRPADVWVAGGSDRFPPYLRQIAVSAHRAIERRQPDALAKLVRWGNLRVLNAHDTLVQQLGFLAEQFAAGGIGRYYEPQLANLYASTWRSVVDRHAAEAGWPGSLPTTLKVIARRDGKLTSVAPSAEGTPPVYVRDTDDELAPSLVSSLDAFLIDIKGGDRARIGLAMEAMFGSRIHRLSRLSYRVRIDGQSLDAIRDAGTVAAVCPWLRPMLATAMEGLKGTDAWQLPADRSSILDRLAGIGFLVAQSVTFEIGGNPVDGPADRSAYLFRTTGGGPLVVSLDQAPLDWSSLDFCLTAICEAIELPSVETSMRLLAWNLREAGEEVGEAVIDGESIGMLCRALRLEPSAEAAVLSLVGAQVDSRLPWIRAAFYYVGGASVLAALHERELARCGDFAGLNIDIGLLAAEHGLPPDELLAASRQALSAGQFRELLDLEFGRFNDSLTATGSEPVTHPDLHASQLANYLVEHEILILEALRNLASERVSRREPEYRYQQWRDGLRAMPSDQAWLLVHHLVPDAVLAEYVQTWLTSLGAPRLGANPNGLAPLAEVRTKNAKELGRFAASATPLIRAWWKAPADTLPDYWRDARSAEQKLRTGLEAAGVFDVAPLNEVELLAWAELLQLWPSSMPASLDRAVLGLDERAIGAAEAAAKRETEERAAAARSVRFNGRDIDPLRADWSAISAEIAEKLPKQIKRARLTTLADLARVTKKSPQKPNDRQPSAPGGSVDRTPAAKKEMIGRLGELVVYHWLKERYPGQDIDKAWVSGNATDQHAKPGSDGFGYDFRLELERRTWLIEVKASQGDSCRFEMGESEVREARKAVRPRAKERYVVVYVADPGNSTATKIDVLPNPFSDEGAKVLEMLGEGIRYGFRRSASL